MGNKIREHLLKLTFEGAAQTVTGSRTLAKYKNTKVYIDCGMSQGPKHEREKNWTPFHKAKSIDAVILTHAHVDHSGLLPKLVEEGFRGPIYCSKATFDLCQILLPDSAHLQSEDAHFANQKGHSKHRPALPLYTMNAVEKTLKLFRIVEDREWVELTSGLSFQFIRNSHILGSRFVRMSYDIGHTQKIHTFTGDIGHSLSRILRPSESFDAGETLVLEGTYGDRVRPKQDPIQIIADLANQVYRDNSVLLIPSFAVGRTQEILGILKELQDQKKLPPLPIFLDSPMAIDATEIYRNHPEELNQEFYRDKIETWIRCDRLEFVRTAGQSELLCRRKGPMIVISAAGMLTGGRILHHLKSRLGEAKNVLLFVGHQVEETKGRLLLNGMRTIRIHHETLTVKAEIAQIQALSAHADSDEMIKWINNLPQKPQYIFLNHGEKTALKSLKYRLENECEIPTHIPFSGQTMTLGKKIQVEQKKGI